MRNTPFMQISHATLNEKGLWEPAPWVNANTLTKQFVQMMLAQFSQIAQTVKDTSNTNRSVVAGLHQFDAVSIGTGTTRGILLGTGQTAASRTDYCLQTPLTTNIAHGTPTFELLNPSGTEWDALIHRTFQNNTGAAFTIYEVGLVTIDGNNSWPLLIDRTLYTITWQIGETKTVSYKFTV